LIPELPLTPNGKVDRRALPEPDELRAEREEVYIAPRSEIERTIAAVWQEMLKVEKVGVHDNFFGLGGHSLLMVNVNSKLREALKSDLSMIAMFKFPTVSALAEHLSQKQIEPPTLQQNKALAENRIEAMNRQRQLRQRRQAKRL
jgi:acyl carrier protein